jgi:hypothetical protein
MKKTGAESTGEEVTGHPAQHTVRIVIREDTADHIFKKHLCTSSTPHPRDISSEFHAAVKMSTDDRPPAAVTAIPCDTELTAGGFS